MVVAYLIDSARREVRQVELERGAETLRKLVNGYIEAAWHGPKGDTIYVDEEGLLKAQPHFFRIAWRNDPMPLGGNGVLVGPEQYDSDGGYVGMGTPTMPIDAVRQAVTFLSREQAESWAKGNASEPSSSFSYVDRDGRVHTETTGRYGQLFTNMPRPEPDVEIIHQGSLVGFRPRSDAARDRMARHLPHTAPGVRKIVYVEARQAPAIMDGMKDAGLVLALAIQDPLMSGPTLLDSIVDDLQEHLAALVLTREEAQALVRAVLHAPPEARLTEDVTISALEKLRKLLG